MQIDVRQYAIDTFKKLNDVEFYLNDLIKDDYLEQALQPYGDYYRLGLHDYIKKHNIWNKYLKIHTKYIKKPYRFNGDEVLRYLYPNKFKVLHFFKQRIRNGKVIEEIKISEEEYFNGKREQKLKRICE